MNEFAKYRIRVGTLSDDKHNSGFIVEKLRFGRWWCIGEAYHRVDAERILKSKIKEGINMYWYYNKNGLLLK